MQIIRNTSAELNTDVLDVPMRPDGTPHRFELIHNNVRVYADTADEILGALIPGYTDLTDPVEQLKGRLHLAAREQVNLQAIINTDLGLEDCSVWETAILCGSRDEQPAIEEWNSTVPIVLIDTYYIPDGDLPRPMGAEDVTNPSNIIWISPENPYDFLLSLHQAGTFVLAEAIETVA